ncbi:hypothetical protein [Lelliottia sp. T2.26D-8]|uniref:hypothetical protein n=1 Tax=Lelliottia sp. T2.26D-8 TaxID=3041165 RepID=UPI0024774D51|nr:hypothetical protein [Lelliottia sp. T2.26D-8]CAI9399202.1 hypothetical protein CCAJJPOJ_00171 [Lelliottia sp. T2.26D-8]
MLSESFYAAASAAIDGYLEYGIFNVKEVQDILDALDLHVELKKTDRADQAVLAIVLAIQIKQRNK